MNKQIVLATKLNAGIAGRDSDVYNGDQVKLPATAAGHAKACIMLGKILRRNARIYGNIGCGYSWLELRDETGVYQLQHYELDKDNFDWTRSAVQCQADANRAQVDADKWESLEREAYACGFLGQKLPEHLENWRHSYNNGLNDGGNADE